MDICCKRFPLGGLWTNGYLFYADESAKPEGGGGSGKKQKTKEAFFIDPGGDAQDVIEYLSQNNLKLKAVLLTHGHLDHLAGIEKLVPFVGEEIYIARDDAPLLKHPPEEVQAALGMECDGVEVFKTVSDGDVLSIGALEIKVMATPGHTPGSVCYMISCGDKNILATGDTLFAQSVGRTDLPGGDWNKLACSLERLAKLPDDLQVLPGHGPDTTIGRERKSNPFWP